MMKREWVQTPEQGSELIKSLARPSDKPFVMSILGPTASGKTGYVVENLRKHQKSISSQPLLVSIDAVTVYKGLDIGSAKVAGADREDFEWIGLDILDPSESITLKRYLDAVETKIAEALESLRPVILCGGSGFYERALVEGLAPGAESDPAFQQSLESADNAQLAKRLYAMGPEWKQKIHTNDRYRLTRYLDLTERQGFSYHDLFHTKIRHPRLRSLWTQTHTLFLGLEWPRETYVTRLGQRIETMFQQGFVEEAESLYRVWGADSPGLASMGYREMIDYFMNRFDLEQSKARILQSHLDYVKKQKTWFRGMK